jgi:hypothetical protein
VGGRDRWFAEGAAALRNTLSAHGMQDMLPTAGEFYACPLCLVTYGRDALDHGVFTREHVPPRHAGGRVLVLTCKRCNDTAGSTIDAEAEGREAVHDFLAGLPTARDLHAEFDVGGARVRGNVSNTGAATFLSVVPQASNPKEVAEMRRILEALAAGGAGGSIGFRLVERVSVTSAKLSWVRAAYLAAFAALGWRYVFMACLGPVRDQLADPSADILPPLALRDSNSPRDRRQLLVVDEPADLRSLAVVIGRYTVFLPSWLEPQPVDTLAAAVAARSASSDPDRFQWVGKQIPWPSKPMYTLDRADI